MAALTSAFALAAAGTALKGYGAIKGASDQKKAIDANAIEDDREADRIDDVGRQNASRRLGLNKRALSSIKAGFGKSGLDLSGSPDEVLMQKALELQLESNDIRQQEAASSDRLRRGAVLKRKDGNRIRKAGILQSVGDVFQFAGQTVGGAPKSGTGGTIASATTTTGNSGGLAYQPYSPLR